MHTDPIATQGTSAPPSKFSIPGIIQLFRTRQQFAFAFLNQFVIGCYGLLLILILVRHCTKEVFGSWILISICFSFSEMLQHGFFQIIIVKAISRHRHNLNYHRLLITHTLLQSFILGCLIYLLLIIVSLSINLYGQFFKIDPYIFKTFVKWYPLYFICILVFNVGWWVQTGLYKFHNVLLQRLVYVVVSMGLILFQVIVYHKVPLVIIIMSQITGYLAASAFALVKGYVRPYFKIHFSMARVKKNFSYGKFNIGTLISSSLLRSVDGIIISFFAGPAGVAVYTLPQKITEFFELILRTNATTLLPTLSSYALDKKKLLIIVFNKALKLSVAFLPFAILVVIFSHQIIGLLSKNSYPESSGILVMFMVYVILLPIDRFSGVLLEALFMPEVNFYKSIVITVFNVTGDILVLKYHLGLPMVALGSSVALIAGLLFVVNFLPVKTLFRPLSMEKV